MSIGMDAMIDVRLTFCGYLLGAAGLRHLWCDLPYVGVDARAHFDYMKEPHSEGWYVRQAYLQNREVTQYLASLPYAVAFQVAFRAIGECYLVLGIFASLSESANSNGIIVSTAESGRPEDFEFVGFDVSWPNPGFHSFLYQPGFLTAQPESVRDLWASRLNRYGLFPTLELAREFRIECQRVLPGEMDIMGVAMHRIKG